MIDNIFIIHWKELIDRKKYLEEKLSEYNVTWIDIYDRNSITNETISKVYKKNVELWNNRMHRLYNHKPEYQEMKISEICNSLSHLYVLDYMIDNNIDYGIVLEDDVILKSDFFQRFDSCFNDTPKDFDIIFFGSSFSPQILDSVGFENDKPAIEIKYGVSVYEKFRNPKTRTVDAYILKKSTCKKLKTITNEISSAYDHDMAYFIKELDLKVYWWEPGLVFQGSQAGYYGSSIR